MADNYIDWGQLGKSLIGQSDEQVLDREKDIYRNPGDKVKRTGIEKIMDGIFRGGSSADLQTLSEDRYVQGLRDEFRRDLAGIDEGVARTKNLPSVDQLDKNDSIESLTKAVNDATRLQSARRSAEGTRDDTGKLQELARNSDNPEEILKAIQTANLSQSRTDYTTNPEVIKADNRYIDAQVASDKRFNATQQLAITQMGIAQQQQANQMQIAQMNNQLQMRRQDSADRRTDRRDRQAMIQQMMAGLSTLGASIAI